MENAIAKLSYWLRSGNDGFHSLFHQPITTAFCYPFYKNKTMTKMKINNMKEYLLNDFIPELAHLINVIFHEHYYLFLLLLFILGATLSACAVVQQITWQESIKPRLIRYGIMKNEK